MNVDEGYANLERMISYGFLFFGANYNGVDFVLKTINEKEIDSLKLYNQSKNQNLDSLYKIALCTFMINGRNLIKDRDKSIPDLIKFYRGLPSVFIFEIAQNIVALQNTSLESAEYLEGYCYSEKSRNLWGTFKHQNMSSDKVVGVEGCDLLGTGFVKETWISMNTRLEEEEAHQEHMRLALLVASSMNPKGVRELTTRMNSQRENLENYRAEICKYGKDKNRIDAKTKNSWTAPLDTREDMVRELHRQMRGEKDKHDIFIEKYFDDMRKRLEDQKQALLDKQKAYKSSLSVNLDQEGSRPATSEEVKRIMTREITPGVEIVEDSEKMTVAKRERFISKTSPVVIKAKE